MGDVRRHAISIPRRKAAILFAFFEVFFYNAPGAERPRDVRCTMSMSCLVAVPPGVSAILTIIVMPACPPAILIITLTIVIGMAALACLICFISPRKVIATHIPTLCGKIVWYQQRLVAPAKVTEKHKPKEREHEDLLQTR